MSSRTIWTWAHPISKLRRADDRIVAGLMTTAFGHIRQVRVLASARTEALLVGVVLAVFVGFLATTLNAPLLERHGFRQTETAYTARLFHQQGIDLLHPKLPVLGAPFEVPFEFPLFQATASLVMDLGVQEDPALRLTGLACFVATALLLFGLVRHVAGRVSGFGALLAFVLNPYALAWSRTSMIEYLATAGAVGFAWATIAWRENRRPATGFLALLAGLIGMLVKPTTAGFWILPALLYSTTGRSASTRRLRGHHLSIAVLVLVPLAASLLWTRHADRIKAASPATAWLTSGELSTWNYGTLAQRLDLETWWTIGTRVPLIVAWGVIFLPPAAIAIGRSSQRLFWLSVTSAALLPPLVLTNLYIVHDYYLVAITPAVAALIGLGFGYVWERLPTRGLFVGSLLGAIAVLAAATFAVAGRYWLPILRQADEVHTLPLARELESATSPGDLVAVEGLGWSPAVLYYAHRWGHMLTFRNHVEYDLIHDQGYRYVLAKRPDDADPDLLARWQWVAALTPHMYAVSDTPLHSADAHFLDTNDVPAAVLRSGRSLVRRPFPLRCDREETVRAGSHGTWIRFARPSRDGRLRVSEDLAPLPVRAAVYVAPQLATKRGVLRLSCTGVRSLSVVDVIDAGA